MPISSKMRADYAELANHYLDNIPVEKPEDFEAILEALMAITEPTVEHQIRPSLQGRVTAIQEILQEPGMYVQSKEEHQEFKEIILQRVAGKIQELNALSRSDKERYIRDQKLLKINDFDDQRNKALMEKAALPVEEASNHSLTTGEWLMQVRERYSEESRLSAAAPFYHNQK